MSTIHVYDNWFEVSRERLATMICRALLAKGRKSGSRYRVAMCRNRHARVLSGWSCS